jgi:cytoskeleton protein RodZ
MVLLVLLAAAAGLLAYHLAASRLASGGAAARSPGAAHPAAHRQPAPASTRAPPAARGSPDVVIVLTAVTEACWADLATPGGATLFQGIIDQGTSRTGTERRAVTLRLGNPAAVTLTVGGRRRTGLGPDPVTLTLAPGQGSSG